jgi:hypothetical protein
MRDPKDQILHEEVIIHSQNTFLSEVPDFEGDRQDGIADYLVKGLCQGWIFNKHPCRQMRQLGIFYRLLKVNPFPE